MTIRYAVADGRRLVLPTSEGAAPGGGNRALAAGEVLEVVGPPSRFVRRRIAAGDLVAVASPPVAGGDLPSPPVLPARQKDR